MKNPFRKIWAWALPLVLIIFSGCNKKILKTENKPASSDTSNILQNLLNNNLEYRTLRIKGKCSVQGEENKISFSYRVHIEKDKKLWASLYGLGLEAVRILIEGDSAAFFNRLEQTYWKGSLSELSKKFGIQGNLSMIETMLIGNCPVVSMEKVPNSDSASPLFSASFHNIPFLIALNSKPKIQRIQMQAPDNKWKSQLYYDNFQPLYNQYVPFKMHIGVQEPKKLEVDLEHKEIEVNPENLSFTFQIPDNYRFVNF